MSFHNIPASPPKRPRTHSELRSEARRAASIARGDPQKPPCAWAHPEWGDIRCVVPPDYEGGSCVFCQRPFQYLTRDHLIPLAAGGADEWWNIAPACPACNNAKADLDSDRVIFVRWGRVDVDWDGLRARVAERCRARER